MYTNLWEDTMIGNNNETEKRLWSIANELRANSKLKSSEYSNPVLGLIFLRHADFKFSKVEKDDIDLSDEDHPLGDIKGDNISEGPDFGDIP